MHAYHAAHARRAAGPRRAAAPRRWSPRRCWPGRRRARRRLRRLAGAGPPTAVRPAAAAAATAGPPSPAGAPRRRPPPPSPPARCRRPRLGPPLRYWRLVDAHRYRALLSVVTPDSAPPPRCGPATAAAFWGIERVRVVSTDAAVAPAAAGRRHARVRHDGRHHGRPASSAWSAGRTLVFMSLRRVGGSWLRLRSGTGP